MSMQPKKCAQCGANTLKHYAMAMNGGRRLKVIEAWLCNDTCATTFFGEKVEA